jgi:hypothetical protein
MEKPATQHHVLVDFENVPDIDLNPIAGKLVRVTLLIGKTQKKLDLTLVRQIHQFAGQVELVEVGASGRNALDLTLAFYLGQAVGQNTATRFHIVSKDKDYVPLITHLQARQIAIERHDSFASLPFIPRPAKTAVVSKDSIDARRTKLFARLADSSIKNRPTTRNRLLADIKANLGPTTSDAAAEDAVRELIAQKTVLIDAQSRVRYTPLSGPS